MVDEGRRQAAVVEPVAQPHSSSSGGSNLNMMMAARCRHAGQLCARSTRDAGVSIEFDYLNTRITLFYMALWAPIYSAAVFVFWHYPVRGIGGAVDGCTIFR